MVNNSHLIHNRIPCKTHRIAVPVHRLIHHASHINPIGAYIRNPRCQPHATEFPHRIHRRDRSVFRHVPQYHFFLVQLNTPPINRIGSPIIPISVIIVNHASLFLCLISLETVLHINANAHIYSTTSGVATIANPIYIIAFIHHPSFYVSTETPSYVPPSDFASV